jgi:mandelate racemase
MVEAHISRITARPVIVPLPRPITTAVGTIPNAPLVLIDLHSDAGVTGSAYIFTYMPLALIASSKLVSEIGETLVGRRLAPAAIYNELAGRFRLLGRQGLVGMALSGIDMAAWDALARQHETSVATLLGAEEVALTCYDSFGIIDPGKDRDALEKSLSRGFGAIKIKIGGGPVEKDLAAVGFVREVIGPSVRLMVDYNQSLSAPEARRRIALLSEMHQLDWVEEPVGAEDFEGHRTVRVNSPVPIQSGENWWMPEGAGTAMAAGISDHAMLDIMKIGGITGWMQAAALAAAHSMPVSSHIFVEASAHALAATPNRHLLEHLDNASPILMAPVEVKGGTVTPRGPGLGIEWNEAAIKHYAA